MTKVLAVKTQPMEDKGFVEVAPSLPLSKTFYYQVPENLRDSLEIGKRVLVPFGKRRITGYALGFPSEIEIEDTKDVLDVLDDSPLFSRDELNFYRWVSTYYFSPLGEVIKTALPKGINIETLQTLSLTEKGTGILASSNGNSPVYPAGDAFPGETYRILKEISGKKGVTLRHLIKRFFINNLRSLLFNLRDEGLVNIEFKQKVRQIKPKTESFVRYQGNSLSREDFASSVDILEKKAPKQATILRFVQDKEKVSFRMLKKEFGNPSVSVKRLKEKGLISVSREEVYRDPFAEYPYSQDTPPGLMKRQQEVLGKIIKGINSGKFSPFLLHGVTGSGKTEVYLRSIEEAMRLGKEAIVMVPEISLTPQLVNRFRWRFGNNIALLHSGLSEGERYDEWRRIKKGEVKIAVGVRSAIFAPFENPGIIIVDEEHETSYKQEDKLRYSARDLAMVRGKLAKAAVIMGSATPSLESYYNSKTGKMTPLSLPERIENRPLPLVEVVDMRDEVKESPREGLIFSKRLKDAVEEALTKEEQIILFLNRRGFATFAICEECGLIIKCPNCSVSLVHHLKGDALHCHYCNYSRQIPNLCSGCRKPGVRSFGLGTQGVEEEVKRLFPDARVARMDRDTTTRKRSHHRILEKFEAGEIDILIGTQMIAKGHDLPKITLVGVISADTSLGFPDFRAGERTFQLLTQVAGRAGRGTLPGKVIIQTFNPEHYSIQQARLHNFTNFYKEEVVFRRELNYPPFCRLINFRISGNSKKGVAEYAGDLGRLCDDLLGKNSAYHKYIEILGPVVAPLEKLKGRYRWQMLIKGKKSNLLHSFARQVMEEAPLRIKAKGVALSVDVDPVNML
ncbi:MAG: primosomal protein N' [Thermodesulfobacteriota bacterium]